MTEKHHLRYHVVQDGIYNKMLIWDTDWPYSPSTALYKASIEEWIKTTGFEIFFVDKEFMSDHWRHFLVFPDRETKVLFKMAFGLP